MLKIGELTSGLFAGDKLIAGKGIVPVGGVM